MNVFPKRALTLLWLACALTLTTTEMAHAHLMAAQHGTLNFTDEGVYLVLSLPVSAFEGVDDNSDGFVTMLEFNHHRDDLLEQVRKNVMLEDIKGSSLLAGILLSPDTAHQLPTQPISHLTVMGRFSTPDYAGPLRFHVSLYGRQIDEQKLEIKATRRRDNKHVVFELRPDTPTGLIFDKG